MDDNMDRDGIFYDIPEDVYHGIDAFSNSKSKLVLDSPAHSRLPFPVTKTLDFGRAFHSAILEPEIFQATYIGLPDFGDQRKTINKLDKEQFIEENPADNYISCQDMEKIKGMKASIMSHPLMLDIFKKGTAETSIFWKDEETGIECKSRQDWKPDKYKMLVDLKSTKDSSLYGFDYELRKYKYYIQSAVYMDSWNRFCDFKDWVDIFIFVAVESTPPYRFNPFFIDRKSDYAMFGLEKWHEVLEIEKECRQKNNWPSYNVLDSEIFELEKPTFLK